MKKIFTLLTLTAGLFFSQAHAQGGSLCQAMFTSSASAPSSGCTVTFTNASTGTNSSTTYAWNFGDNQTSTSQNPVHTYTASNTYSVCLTITVPGTNGLPACTDTYCMSISVQCGSSTGVVNLLDEKAISIYPNPSTGKFQLTIDNNQLTTGNLNVKIYNILGEKAFSISTVNNHGLTIDLTSQPSGVYFLEIVTPAGGSVVKKMIKE